MGYLFLLLTILTESAAVVLMKLSQGFSQGMYALAAVAAYGLSFLFLTLALKYLPAGIANAIWAGASTILIVIAGIIFLKEPVSLRQWLFIALIAIGIVGLNLTGKAS